MHPATGEEEAVYGRYISDVSCIPPPLEDEEPVTSPKGIVEHIGAVSDGAEEKLKRLLKAGLRAISRYQKDEVLEDASAVLPIVIGCSMAIDETAKSDFVEPEAKQKA